MSTFRRPDRLALLGATAGNAVTAFLGLYWLLRPDTDSFYDVTTNALLAAVAGSGPAVVVHTLTAGAGVIAGIAAYTGALGRSGVLVIGAIQVLVFGVALGSMATLAVAGYLVAMSMPIVIVLVLLQVVRRYRIARWALGIPGLIASIAGIVLAREALGVVATNLATGISRDAGRLAMVLLLLTTGFAWAVCFVAAAGGYPFARRATDWVARHRRLFTVIAAIGPLPYALVRLTWLTPWPAHITSPESLDLATRIWGLTLSSGAWLGCVLTLGLIRPWGEVFPRWMPGLAGRTVPIAVAAVPGGLVATVVSFTALPMLHTASARGVDVLVETALTFPCWFWGPALALAVWGYVGHRRTDAAQAVGSLTQRAAR